MRLNRYLAAAGLGSRRGVESLVTEGHVIVNGDICQTLATEVGPDDVVQVDGRTVKANTEKLYVLLHKPRGYVSTARDPEERRTIFDLVPPDWPRLFHVGRLDKDSEGLLLLTNDGELANRLTHARHGVEKEYLVELDKPFQSEDAAKLLKGFFIEGERAKMEKVIPGPNSSLTVVLHQGIKRQIRQMLYFSGYDVKRLRRIRVGPILLKGVPAGAWRFLRSRELSELRAAAGLDKSGEPIKVRPEGAAAATAAEGRPPRSPDQRPARPPRPAGSNPPRRPAPRPPRPGEGRPRRRPSAGR